MFSRARAAGLWIPGSVVDQGEFEHLDDYSYAVDGRGGTYAPATQIVVGGAGLSLSGSAHEVTGTLTVASLALITIADGGTIKANGSGAADITLKVVSNVALLDVESGASVRIKAGGSLDVFGALTLKKVSGPGSLTAEDTTAITLNSGAQIIAADGSTVNLHDTNLRKTLTLKSVANGGPGAINGEDDALLTGVFIQQALLAHDGAGRARWRHTTLTDASQTVSIASKSIVRINNTCAANRTITVSTSLGTPKNGDWMLFYRSTPQGGTIADSSLYSVQLESDTGAVLYLWTPASNKTRAGVLIVFSETDNDWVPVLWNNLGGTGTGLFGA